MKISSSYEIVKCLFENQYEYRSSQWWPMENFVLKIKQRNIQSFKKKSTCFSDCELEKIISIFKRSRENVYRENSYKIGQNDYEFEFKRN